MEADARKRQTVQQRLVGRVALEVVDYLALASVLVTGVGRPRWAVLHAGVPPRTRRQLPLRRQPAAARVVLTTDPAEHALQPHMTRPADADELVLMRHDLPNTTKEGQR